MSGLPNNDNKKLACDRELLVSKSKQLARDAASINGADGGCCVAIAMPGEGERELKLKLNSAAIFIENPQVNSLLQDISAGGKIVFVSICMKDEYTWPPKGFFQFLHSEALIYSAHGEGELLFTLAPCLQLKL